LGAEKAAGAGVPEEEVTHGGEPGILIPWLATQPAGNAGAVTASKFSFKPIFSKPSLNVYVTVPRSLAPSCICIVAVIVPPHKPEDRKVKFLQTAGPPLTTTP
jgi:hypothetical protein